MQKAIELDPNNAGGWTNLSGANLRWVDLRCAKYDATTVWPEGFDPVAAGAVLVEDDD